MKIHPKKMKTIPSYAWTFESAAAAKAAADKQLGQNTPRTTSGSAGTPFVLFFQPRNRFLWELSQGRGYVCADGVIRTDIRSLLATQ